MSVGTARPKMPPTLASSNKIMAYCVSAQAELVSRDRARPAGITARIGVSCQDRLYYFKNRSDLYADVASRWECQNYYDYDRWFAGHRNGASGLANPNSADINRMWCRDELATVVTDPTTYSPRSRGSSSRSIATPSTDPMTLGSGSMSRQSSGHIRWRRATPEAEKMRSSSASGITINLVVSLVSQNSGLVSHRPLEQARILPKCCWIICPRQPSLHRQRSCLRHPRC
jgi:hypothetical protein